MRKLFLAFFFIINFYLTFAVPKKKFVVEKKDFYTVAFKKYKDGKHQLSYTIKDDFIEKFPFRDVRALGLKADVEMNKSTHFLHFDIHISGNINIKCGRCLEYFDLPVDYTTELSVELANHSTDLSEADKQISINCNDEFLVFDKHFHDYIMLSIPYKPAHSKDENGQYRCNPEMLEQLEKYSSKNNKEETDPRWDKLKSIFNN
jgi:uncharacterized metal-binding protein YceD (DUF177 family)